MIDRVVPEVKVYVTFRPLATQKRLSCGCECLVLLKKRGKLLFLVIYFCQGSWSAYAAFSSVFISTAIPRVFSCHWRGRTLETRLLHQSLRLPIIPCLQRPVEFLKVRVISSIKKNLKKTTTSGIRSTSLLLWAKLKLFCIVWNHEN